MKSCFQGYTSETIDTSGKDVWDILKAVFVATNEMIGDANMHGRIITGVRFNRGVNNLTNQWDDSLHILSDVKNKDMERLLKEITQ